MLVDRAGDCAMTEHDLVNRLTEIITRPGDGWRAEAALIETVLCGSLLVAMLAILVALACPS